MPEWCATWRTLRAVPLDRDWMTLEEFTAALAARGFFLTRWHRDKALIGCEPSQFRGVRQYLEKHVEAAAEYAEARGLTA